MKVRLAALLALILSVASSAEAERLTGTINQSGMWRYFIIHTPEGVKATPSRRRSPSAETYPVIFAFHPAATTGEGMEHITELHQLAKDHIVVYPTGLGGTWNVGNCCGEAREAGVDDVEFFTAMMAYLESRVANIEPRAYLTGFSNGALLTYRLLCEEAESVAAAVPYGAMPDLGPDCQPSRNVPILHLHGGADPVAPFEGGPTPNAEIQEHPSALNEWRYLAHDRYGLHGETATNRFDGTVPCLERGDGSAVICEIPDLGHVWPGHVPLEAFWGPTRPDLDGSEDVMRFFREHR